jgi:hypothetical protein
MSQCIPVDAELQAPQVAICVEALPYDQEATGPVAAVSASKCDCALRNFGARHPNQARLHWSVGPPKPGAAANETKTVTTAIITSSASVGILPLPTLVLGIIRGARPTSLIGIKNPRALWKDRQAAVNASTLAESSRLMPPWMISIAPWRSSLVKMPVRLNRHHRSLHPPLQASASVWDRVHHTDCILLHPGSGN